MTNQNAPIGRPGRPTGWRRRVLRLPVLAYRVGLGSLFGKRLLLLHHTGRVSGRDHTTVLEVVSFDAVEASWTVASGFGPKADWYRNLRAHPQTLIRFGSHPHPVTARFLPADDGAAIMADYARRHPRTARRLCAFMGLPVDGSDESFRAAGRAIPFVRLEAGAGHSPAGRRHH
ncbi:nitroreductase family deazaflavin-dependent oxidoreductase [Streptomyces griseoincarnatus]|uniref:nitroreductase family deazaflavin-dependent oxidoreductase n=1 Tax=unclassified Streptomyces TaxID=2593676 RepID=UPI000C88624F|nr:MULTISPECIES: nitroreductase family deazaflavin-dependent oxidoreductase [unclassified Streptomyces]MBJ6642951.1 nitroreductase family deazaflavin-dependent oxidoreductase [Streptomyces sp. BSE7-9]MCA2201487.1 nitroreductase family deazaflavin-dependent oxidoreductase [Streptomyces sp. SMS_SU21]NEA95441.1 nitroreductase family deazaflavin-dependent oxidoreductase [Actinospica acidiphila]PWE10118.1 nitroreductase family deazaflavin-dependent oxidoreductase [Streptomyces sp. BSE7F]